MAILFISAGIGWGNVDDATGDAEQKAYIAERVALHASGDTQSSRDGTDDAE